MFRPRDAAVRVVQRTHLVVPCNDSLDYLSSYTSADCASSTTSASMFSDVDELCIEPPRA